MTDTTLIRCALGRVTANAGDRTLTGSIVHFDRATSDGRRFTAGGLKPRLPLTNVKLLVEHDAERPVGFMTDYADEGARAVATFQIAEGAEGDRVLADATGLLRDGFSVGVAPSALKLDADSGELVIEAGEIVEVSVVSVPAFNDTRATATPRKEPAMSEDTTEPQAAQASELVTAAAQPASAPAPTPAPQPAPTALPQQASTVHTAPRGYNFAAAVQHVSQAFNSGNKQLVTAALADILLPQDAGGAFIQNDWLGELFTAARTDRPWINSFGPVQQLTSLKGKGWRWVTKPAPAKYAGGKAEVPTGTIETEEAEFVAERWAGGWDIDRAFVDFSSTDFLAAFWTAAMEEYLADSDADIASKVETLALANTDTATTLLGALSSIARELRGIGGRATRIVLGDDLFDEWADLKVADVPHWLANVVGGVNIVDGTAQIGQLVIDNDPTIAAGTVVAYDRRAATVREKSPIQVKAFDVAHAGIDLGFYSYGRLDVHDPRLILSRTVTAA